MDAPTFSPDTPPRGTTPRSPRAPRHQPRTTVPLSENRIYLMDALEGLSKLPASTVDLVITDPPYNIARKDRTTIRHGRVMSTLEAWGAWDCYHPFDYDLLILRVLSECYRVLKPDGSLYMFTAKEDNGYFIRRAVERGFTYRSQLVLAKKSPLPSLSRRNWRSGFDLCLYVSKGRPVCFNFPGQAELRPIYAYATTHKYSDHPTEKPLELIRRLVLISSNEGDLVVDPFMGSGTTAVAAKETGRRYLGFELCREYMDMARRRLRSKPAGR